MESGKTITTTARLVLREMSEADYDAIYAVLADSDIMRHYPYTFDAARVRGWIARNMERYRTDGFGLWAVVSKDTSEVIGDCGITMQQIHGQPLPEIGYHIRADCQRMGYASEAASECIRLAFERFGFPAVYSYMKHTNIPSAATAAKCGMRLLEEYADPANGITKVYGITRVGWCAQYGD